MVHILMHCETVRTPCVCPGATNLSFWIPWNHLIGMHIYTYSHSPRAFPDSKSHTCAARYLIRVPYVSQCKQLHLNDGRWCIFGRSGFLPWSTCRLCVSGFARSLCDGVQLQHVSNPPFIRLLSNHPLIHPATLFCVKCIYCAETTIHTKNLRPTDNWNTGS